MNIKILNSEVLHPKVLHPKVPHLERKSHAGEILRNFIFG